jgi:hypothetical protein
VAASSVALGVALATAALPVAATDMTALAEKAQLQSTYLRARYQTANVFDGAAGPSKRQGAAWLVRTKNEIKGRIMTNVPSAGDPYTLWLVVFNNPSECATLPCSGADIANPAVAASVYNGSGAISASNGLGGGVINIDFRRLAGKLPTDLFLLAGDPRGLIRNRGFTAEVHLVVDQHPSIAPGADSWIADLTTTHPPGGGPNTRAAVSIFLGCPDPSCPASVL